MTDNLNKYEEKVFVIEPITVNFNENLKELNDETFSLIESADSIPIYFMPVKIREITPSTFIGSGKLLEIKDKIVEYNANCVLFDGVLSPSQTINMSDALNVKVIDRTTLILDIFAKNAKSHEGKLQVELAQLSYVYPRLKGKGSALSRLGGGIGTRGPGETKLETDRRHIRTRIDYLKAQIENIKTRRNLQTYRRNKNSEIVVSLIGYTNTGKSTLLNLLTSSNVLAENKLFATLDTTIRKAKINDL
ncbi:MAG: GTPase HflX, partial [Clostridia bacterium]|nr:GTPase HflX [Clostridia bacterium]